MRDKKHTSFPPQKADTGATGGSSGSSSSNPLGFQDTGATYAPGAATTGHAGYYASYRPPPEHGGGYPDGGHEGHNKQPPPGAHTPPFYTPREALLPVKGAPAKGVSPEQGGAPESSLHSSGKLSEGHGPPQAAIERAQLEKLFRDMGVYRRGNLVKHCVCSEMLVS